MIVGKIVRHSKYVEALEQPIFLEHSAHIQQIISQILMISRQKGFLIIETERSLKSLESLARLIEVRWFL